MKDNWRFALIVWSVFRQICFADVSCSQRSCLSLCMYMCVSQCVSFWVNVCFRVIKILKIYLYGIKHLQSNGSSLVFLLFNFDLHYQGQTFGILFDLRISRKWQTILLASSRKNSICHYEYCTSWPWPTFSSARILKCECLENVEN